MRLGILLVVLGVGMTVLGIEGVHNARTYSHPKTITYKDFVRTRPAEGWFRITGGEIDVSEGVYERSAEPRGMREDKSGVPVELTEKERQQDVWILKAWFPLHAAGAEKGDKAEVVLYVEDDTPANVKLLSAAEELVKAQEQKMPRQEFQKWAIQNAERLFVNQDFQGMVDAGFMAATQKTKDQIQQLNTELAPSFVIFDQDHSPASTQGAAFLLGAGIFFDILSVLVWLQFFLSLFQRRGR